MSQYFHFTLGPVQSFVAQARRTRDFWAGSFLLSWLAGVAMQEVIHQGGEIVFPKADEDFLAAINGNANSLPTQGNIPNRFKAKVSDSFKPENVVSAVTKAWSALATLIYQHDVAPVANPNTQRIWDRQVQHFWDMSWVIVDNEANSAALDQRKNIRCSISPDDPGIKCSLMGDWQELSGIEGVHGSDREKRDVFWKKIANNVNSQLDFSAESKEHLCALSFIKRRFYVYFHTIKEEINGWTVHGWQVAPAVPSVSYLAAVPWWSKVLAEAEESDFLAFAESAKALSGLTEKNSRIQTIETAAARMNRQAYKGIDGSVFHEFDLDNPNKTEQSPKVHTVKKALRNLQTKFGKVSPFYAVLMMDGDQLGKQMSDLTKQEFITQGLQQFIAEVPTLVSQHDGFLIYAGGDDVLALLPLDRALDCAVRIRAHYQKVFKQFTTIQTTISAALIYSHIKHPLKSVLMDAHQVLDHVAKDGAGRNALAVTVYKGSGQVIEWAKKWDDLLVNNTLITEQLLRQFNRVSTTSPQFSSKFFYGIRERFSIFKDVTSTQEHKVRHFSFDDAVAVMCAQFIQSADNLRIFKDIFVGDNLQAMATQFVRPLLEHSQDSSKHQQITADFALFVRFLSQKGLEERGV